MSAPHTQTAVTIRQAQPEDAPACGRICFEAFHKISTDHNFPPDLPAPEVGVALLARMFANPSFYCVVAEHGGHVVGSNCLDERSSIAGVGPITVDPAAQNSGAGRALMNAVLERAQQRNHPGVRLVQAAFHNRSLSLYTKLGFDPREPLSCMQGKPLQRTVDGCRVRPARESDLEACNRVCRQVHGHDRAGELADAIREGTAQVVERDGRITAYTTFLRTFGGRNQRRLAGADRRGARIRRLWYPGAHAQCRLVPLVFGERPACCSADDPHEHRTLQRARRRLDGVDSVLRSS
jgi:predicted N-acetyltransferase YhbS